jgi:hypothetical protein
VFYGAVRRWACLSVRSSYGACTQSDPYATYGAPPSDNTHKHRTPRLYTISQFTSAFKVRIVFFCCGGIYFCVSRVMLCIKFKPNN